jgi:hypothetical protein
VKSQAKEVIAVRTATGKCDSTTMMIVFHLAVSAARGRTLNIIAVRGKLKHTAQWMNLSRVPASLVRRSAFVS